MSDKTVEDEITRELAKFGHAAVYAFQAWQRANPNATRVPRKVWKQMDRLDRDERWNAKIQVRQQLRTQGAQRKEQRGALYTQLEKELTAHRNQAVSWHNAPAHTYEQHMFRQWELVRDRERIERLITSSGVLSKEERGHAVNALQAAHFAYQPKVTQIPARPGPLAGFSALKARAADRLSRIRLGITERGRTGHRPQPDRPAVPKTHTQVMEELRHLIAERHEMAATADILGKRLRERGASIATFAPDAAQMGAGHKRNLAALDREINNRITGSGLPVEDWLDVQFQLNEPNTPERQASQRWLERRGQWDLENRYRIESWDSHVNHVTGDDYRRWDHDFPEIEDRQRREFLNPPAGWEPTAMDAEDRFMFLLDHEGNTNGSHVRTFGYPESGYDWVQRKMSWISAPHENVSVTVWDRAIPLDANDRVRGFAVDSIQGLYAHIEDDLTRRYEQFSDLSMKQARDRSIPAELSVPGLEDINGGRQRAWSSVRANNITAGDQIHSIGESGRVWTVYEAQWFDDRLRTREQLEEKFGRIQRDAFWDINEGMYWSEDIEKARFALDHTEVLTAEERARAREILTITETEAKLGQKPDRNLWAAVTGRGEFDRWSGLKPPGTPERPQQDLVGRARSVQTELRDRAAIDESRRAWDAATPVRPVTDARSDLGAPQRPAAPEGPAAPAAPEAPTGPAGSVVIVQSEVFDRMSRDLEQARKERDEAVAKLIKRTPPEQRYGSPQRRQAERPQAPEAPEAPAQPDREELPPDRDELPAYDRSDVTAAESVPDWSGVPEPPEPPEFEPIPSGHNGWDGFER
ncbi:hypothetical protein [Nocardia tengchongensis]|uniref:hypothetical protein n=1 Tax=Nocardia tengchongensis TaxID=2055889 RepID=UPI0036B042BC